MRPGISLSLSHYLSKATHCYQSCLDLAGPTETAACATVRFHHLKLDPFTGEPKFRDLAKVLSQQLREYCFDARKNAAAIEPYQQTKLYHAARDLFTKRRTSGESGEILVYFLLEAILEAPQMIAKMQLKTNPKMELNGADGVHFKWNEEGQTLELYCAESKLEDSPSGAIANCVKSLESFHETHAYEHEISLATSHFKHANDDLKELLIRILDGEEPNVQVKLNHACLVGYDWHGYKGLAAPDIRAMEAQFRARYQDDRARILELIAKHFGTLKHPLIGFEVFILPFRTVQEFRDAFIAAL